MKRKAIIAQAFPLERNVVVGYSEKLDSESKTGAWCGFHLVLVHNSESDGEPSGSTNPSPIVTQ